MTTVKPVYVHDDPYILHTKPEGSPVLVVLPCFNLSHYLFSNVDIRTWFRAIPSTGGPLKTITADGNGAVLQQFFSESGIPSAPRV